MKQEKNKSKYQPRLLDLPKNTIGYSFKTIRVDSPWFGQTTIIRITRKRKKKVLS